MWSCHDQPGYKHSIAYGVGLLESCEGQLIGHNALKFDLQCLKETRGFRKNPKAIIRDALICSRLIWPELGVADSKLLDGPRFFPPGEVGSHSLKAWGYRLGVLKGDFNNEQTDWSKWSAQMQTYCEQDVRVTKALLDHIERQKYSERAIQLAHDFSEVIHLQENFGCPFDTQGAAELYASLAERRSEIEGRLQEVFPPRIETMRTPAYYVGWDGFTWHQKPTKGECKRLKLMDIAPGPMKTKTHPFNPGSRQEIAERLKERGWVPTTFTPTGLPTVDETTLAGFDAIPETKLLIEYLTIQKVIGTVAEGKGAWLKLEKNGRLHGQVMVNGCVSRRCSHNKPNLGNVPAVNKDPKTKQPLMGYEGAWGYECRSLFIPDRGYDMVGYDASGIQLRALAHYMAAFDGGAYGKVVCEGDPHSLNQQAAGLKTRDDAKTFIYAYLFGCGGHKAGSIYYGTNPVPPEDIEFFKERWPSDWKTVTWRILMDGKTPNDQDVAKTLKGMELKTTFEKKTPALGLLKAAILLKVEKPDPRKHWIMKRIKEAQSLLRSAGFPVPRYTGYLLSLDGGRLTVRSAHSALNLLLQAFEAVVMQTSTVMLHRTLKEKGWEFGREYAKLLDIHDEAQMQAKHGLGDELGRMAVESIRRAGEILGVRVPLAGEYKIGRNWAETH